jgi:putative restriction endonuclease
MAADGTLIYRYHGTDANHRDNVGLRLAMTRRVPLVYLFGLVPGAEYQLVWPVFIVGDDPAALSFHVSVDNSRAALGAPLLADAGI